MPRLITTYYFERPVRSSDYRLGSRAWLAYGDELMILNSYQWAVPFGSEALLRANKSIRGTRDVMGSSLLVNQV